jgi:antitoxin HicB
MSKKHMGSSIDDFMKEEGILEEAQVQAIEEVVAWQLGEAMKKNIHGTCVTRE